MDPDAVFCGNRTLPGSRATVTTIQPASSLDYRAPDWVGAAIVVSAGRLQLECWSGARAFFDEGAVLFLTGLDLRRLTNPGLGPLVITTIRRDPTTKSRTQVGSPEGAPSGQTDREVEPHDHEQ